MSMLNFSYHMSIAASISVGVALSMGAFEKTKFSFEKFLRGGGEMGFVESFSIKGM